MRWISIQINGDNAIYPGKQITGKVIVKSEEPLKYQSIRISLIGKEKSTTFANARLHDETFRFLKQETVVSKHGPVLGHVEFPFSIRVPDQSLLPSYEHDRNGIYYKLKAEVDRPLWFDMVAEYVLVVFPMKHPNSSVLMDQRMKVEKELSIGSCCYPQGNVLVTLSGKRLAFFRNLNTNSLGR
jgi:hypothetical protein